MGLALAEVFGIAIIDPGGIPKKLKNRRGLDGSALDLPESDLPDAVNVQPAASQIVSGDRQELVRGIIGDLIDRHSLAWQT